MLRNDLPVRELIDKLVSFENMNLKRDLAKGVLLTIFIFSLTFLALVSVEIIINGGTLFRSVLFFLLLISFLAPFTFYIALPVFRRYNPFSEINYLLIADKAGSLFPDIRDNIKNSLQLIQKGSENRFSDKLISAAFLDLYEKIRAVNFNEKINFDTPKKLLLPCFAVVFASFGPLFVSGNYADSAERIINFNSAFTPPAKYKFELSPGNYLTTRGEAVTIKVKVDGPVTDFVDIYTKDETQPGFIRQRIKTRGSNEFELKLGAVQASTEYYAELEGYKSDEYTITVTDRPAVESFTVSVSPPAYSGEKGYTQTDDGNVSGLYGTSVSFDVNATKKLSSAWLEFSDSLKIPLKTDGFRASGAVTLKQEASYTINVSDENGKTNIYPVKYNLMVKQDAAPAIDLITPRESGNLPNDQRQQVVVSISDDYGFSKLYLYYKLIESRSGKPHEKYTRIEVPLTGSGKTRIVEYIWNLSMMFLNPLDKVTFYLEVSDNDAISGPKSARTKDITVKVPSLEEIFDQLDNKQAKIEDNVSKTVKEAEELRKEMEKLSKDLKQDKQNLTWEEKERIEKAAERFEELHKKAEEISKELKETKDQLQENKLLSKETLEKYMELQKMMDELSSPEFKDAMEKLQKTLQNMNRKQAQADLEQMQFDEEAFKKSLERTMNLLKRVQLEQKIDELSKRAEDLKKSQENLQKQASESDADNKNQQEKLGEKQNEISEKIDKMKEEFSDLKEKFSELKDLPQELAEKTENEFDKQNNDELSEQAKEMMKQGKMQQAMQNQQKISQNMKQNMQNLQEMKDALAQQNQMQTFSDLMKMIDNIATLSQEQEELKSETEKSDINSLLNEEMRKQDNLRRNLDKILQQMSELSQKTFAITPEMGKALGTARNKMMSALNQMQNRGNFSAANDQGQAMKSLNEAAQLAQNSLQSMMQQGAGQKGGMMSLLQQMGQMSGQQMTLNNMTQQLMQGMQGNMSPEQQQMYEKLARQQELIRKSMEQLNKEAKESGKSKTLPANLDKILKEMQEVVADMKTQKLTDELVQKQEKILSKMLDAQRSINERDYEKERESFTGINIKGNTPGEIVLKKDKDGNWIYDTVNNPSGNFTGDYQNLVKKYFEAMNGKGIKQ
ncbi:MAG: hypothetical protein HUU43_12295 [Ignavibacteriaceae bacterium]|nr:hypothetical protein [Ignavibacteriaceae bacterium]